MGGVRITTVPIKQVLDQSVVAQGQMSLHSNCGFRVGAILFALWGSVPVWYRMSYHLYMWSMCVCEYARECMRVYVYGCVHG